MLCNNKAPFSNVVFVIFNSCGYKFFYYYYKKSNIENKDSCAYQGSRCAYQGSRYAYRGSR